MSDEAQERLNNWIKWGFQALILGSLALASSEFKALTAEVKDYNTRLTRLESQGESQIILQNYVDSAQNARLSDLEKFHPREQQRRFQQ